MNVERIYIAYETENIEICMFLAAHILFAHNARDTSMYYRNLCSIAFGCFAFRKHAQFGNVKVFIWTKFDESKLFSQRFSFIQLRADSSSCLSKFPGKSE